MKGPSLHHDLRVLRLFCCDACGRQVQAPAYVTSHTCQCSDPPKFMRPLERPRTVSPDVSRFISPPDPEELLEVPDVDETPYVPHVPVKPPPPARFANRRKLYDETTTEVEPDFGEGIVSDSENDVINNSQPEREGSADDRGVDTDADRRSRAPENRGRNRERSRGRQNRGRSGGPGNDPSGKNVAPQAPRQGTQRPETRPPRDPGNSRHPHKNPAAATDGSSGGDNVAGDRDSGSNSSASDNSPTEQGDGRKRSRRRGRRRGPRPEGGSA